MAFDGPGFVKHVAERLIHEFQFSTGAGTPGLVGATKEHPARVQLERLMPGNVGVGSGIVVDSYGAVSRQQDIVIYEKLAPIFTHNDAPEATYYPIEGVVAVGEVKSALGKAELQDAILKSVSVKSLRRRAEASADLSDRPSVSYRTYGSPVEFVGTPEEQFDQDRKSLDQVCSFVLCQRLTASPKATLDNFVEESREVGPALAPNILVSLEDGSIHAFNSKSRSLARALMDGDGAVFAHDPVAGFVQLVSLLRSYATSGRTVDRKHLETYFRPIGGPGLTLQVGAHVSL